MSDVSLRKETSFSNATERVEKNWEAVIGFNQKGLIDNLKEINFRRVMNRFENVVDGYE